MEKALKRLIFVAFFVAFIVGLIRGSPERKIINLIFIAIFGGAVLISWLIRGRFGSLADEAFQTNSLIHFVVFFFLLAVLFAILVYVNN